MVKFNPLAISKLKTQEQTNQAANIFCCLEIIGTDDRFDFLLNPSSIDNRVSANYESSPSAGTNVPRLQFRYGEAIEMTLNGLIMFTTGHRTSLKPLIDALIGMTRSDPDKQRYNAPVCAFVWGKRRLDACVVKSFDYKETMWNMEGEPVHVEGSLTLTEVLPESKPKAIAGSATQSTPKLSERELQSGSKSASEWVKANTLKLPSEVQQRVKLSQYKLRTNTATGEVLIEDSKGNKLASIGTNERGVFKPK